MALAGIAIIWLAGCGGDGTRSTRSTTDATDDTPRMSARAKPAATSASADDTAALMIAAYRFEFSLHASDADRGEFGGFFLDYPRDQEGVFLQAFAQNSPPVRPKQWCRMSEGQSVIDQMTGKAGISFVAEVKKIEGQRALVMMNWWSDPDLAAGALLGLERQDGAWQVTGYQPVWMR